MKFLIKLQNSFYSVPVLISNQVRTIVLFVCTVVRNYLRPYLKFKCDFIKEFGFNI